MRFLLFFLLFNLSGCALVSPLEHDPNPADIPSRFSLYSEKPNTEIEWWQEFDSAELNSLINHAVKENFSIKETWARLSQARYSAVKAGAALYPELKAAGSGTYFDAKTNGIKSSSDEWSLGLTAAYEIDLWGRVRAGQESLLLKSQASAEDLKSAIMSVSGQIAENWVSLIANLRQQQLFNRQLELQKQLLKLIKLRFSKARSTALDIYQQQQAIEKIRLALVPIISRQQFIKRQLGLLSGRAAIDLPQQTSFPLISPVPALGLPADFLAARPDVRAAGLRLKAAEWEIAAAKADRLPALKLTASHTYSSEEISSLFDNWLLNLAANLTGPVFDGSRRAAEVERTKAVVDERLAAYRQTVFTAIKEVEDALAEEEQYRKTIASLKRQIELGGKTIREARGRYLNGSSDFLNVLKEELNLLNLRQDVIIAQEKMIIARIHLNKAIAGYWLN